MKRENKISCTIAEDFYYDMQSGQKVPENVAEHLSTCTHCISRISELGRILSSSKSTINPGDYLGPDYTYWNLWVSCNECKPFLPLLIFRKTKAAVITPITAHLNHCPACQKDMASLDQFSGESLLYAARFLSDQPCGNNLPNQLEADILESIKRRPDSGIAVKLAGDSVSDPQVILNKQIPKQDIHGLNAIKYSVYQYKYLLKPGIAAALILIASLVMFLTPTLKGVGLKDIYTALNDIQNCKIDVYTSEDNHLVQEIILSRPLMIQIFNGAGQITVRDMNNGKMLHSYPPLRNDESSVISTENSLAQVKSPFGLMPFTTIQDMPGNFQWQRQTIQNSGGNLDIYDLTWKETKNHSQLYKRWRGYLNRNTCLPVRIEWWEKIDQDEYRQTLWMQISYPETGEVLNDIQKLGISHIPDNVQ